MRACFVALTLAVLCQPAAAGLRQFVTGYCTADRTRRVMGFPAQEACQ